MGDLLNALTGFLQVHPELTLALVFLVSFGEALLLIGLFMPSTVVLVAAGTMVGLGQIGFIPVFFLTTLGAVVGDAFAFWLGYHYKDRLRSLNPFKGYKTALSVGEAYFNRHGGKSIFVVRFIPGLKAIVPSIAAMVGMRVWHFALINVVSALFWAAVHLFPAIALGRGIKVTQTTNPRLMVLLVLLVITLTVAWYITRAAYALLLPRAERLRYGVAAHMAQSRLPGMRRMSRLLTNENGMLLPFLYLVLSMLALSGFLLLAGQVVLDPTMARSDEAISAFVQTLRNDMFTKAMLTTTMLGDGAVLAPVAVLLVLVFVAYRHWNIAGSLTLAFVAASLFVPLTKSTLHRSRPISLFDGADSYSFPSGHSTMSMVVLGLVALTLAQSVPLIWRRMIYLVAAMLIALIGFSRIYLLAHWPTDVAAGFLFGGGLVFLMAVFLHQRRLRVPLRAYALLCGVAFLGLFPLHLYRDFPDAVAQYRVTDQPRVITHLEWELGGWQDLPTARVLLGGELGEPMLLQTDLPLDRLIPLLTSAGYSLSEAGRIDGMLAAVLPARGPLAPRATLPLTNIGQKPLATLVRMDPGGQSRTALRIWKTDTILAQGDALSPLLLVSGSKDYLNTLFAGYAVTESLPMTLPQTEALRAEILAALPEDLPIRIDRFGTPILASAAAP